jgi:hypothetical protein
MRLYRSPESIEDWDMVYEKGLAEWASDWSPDKQLVLDGTIDKEGERHTRIGIRFDEQDLRTLEKALISYRRQRVRRIEMENKELSRRVEVLEAVLRKLYSLAQYHRDRAPTDEELISVIGEICQHFSIWSDANASYTGGPKWLKWRTLSTDGVPFPADSLL